MSHHTPAPAFGQSAPTQQQQPNALEVRDAITILAQLVHETFALGITVDLDYASERAAVQMIYPTNTFTQTHAAAIGVFLGMDAASITPESVEHALFYLLRAPAGRDYLRRWRILYDRLGGQHVVYFPSPYEMSDPERARRRRTRAVALAVSPIREPGEEDQIRLQFEDGIILDVPMSSVQIDPTYHADPAQPGSSGARYLQPREEAL